MPKSVEEVRKEIEVEQTGNWSAIIEKIDRACKDAVGGIQEYGATNIPKSVPTYILHQWKAQYAKLGWQLDFSDCDRDGICVQVRVIKNDAR